MMRKWTFGGPPDYIRWSVIIMVTWFNDTKYRLYQEEKNPLELNNENRI